MNKILCVLVIFIMGCGTTGKLEPAEGVNYVLTSHGCSGLISKYITGEVCYWKATSSSSTTGLVVDVTSEDEWSMIGTAEENKE